MYTKLERRNGFLTRNQFTSISWGWNHTVRTAKYRMRLRLNLLISAIPHLMLRNSECVIVLVINIFWEVKIIWCWMIWWNCAMSKRMKQNNKIWVHKYTKKTMMHYVRFQYAFFRTFLSCQFCVHDVEKW